MPPKKPVAAKAAAKPVARPAAKVTAKGPAAKPTAVRKGPPVPAAAAKKGAPAAKQPAKADQKNAAPTKAKVSTKQDVAARTIQTHVRRHQAKKKLDSLKKEKQQYEELMDKLEKEAFVKLVKMQQEEAEKERQKEEEERRKKREAAKRIKRILEAAFDGDDDEILGILKEVSDVDTQAGLKNDVIGRALRNKHLQEMVDCEDANENTPISEAASGGHVSTIKLLIDKGADVNTKGQFQRTPLYRAAFAGHVEACEVLLQHGADPRLYASDGQTPEHVASAAALVELLRDWDVEQTDVLLQKIAKEKERRIEEDKKRREAETDKLEDALKEAEREYKVMEKQLNTAYCELNKRIYEHDNAAAEGFDKPELTLQTIHDAEADLDILKIDHEKARDKVAKLRLKLREQQKQGAAGFDEDSLPGLKVMIRELDDVLLRDVGNKINDSGCWPLIIDPSGQAATFLRYRDTNYICALRPVDMEPERIRLAVLGAVRFGKPLILDMMEIDMFDTCSDRFDEVQKGLLGWIMDKSIMQPEKYLKLVKKTDDDDYQKNRFIDYRTANFRLFIITKNKFPPDDLLEKTYVIRVFIPV
ncbi:IQ motif and ankyrin repeat domain-containing protein 1-like [Lineus longissimus]|uniref:IQ motif and ankyrin repeat domain-containing protein 1-like n=1 Tax=Lineus longissimus TaxID=88925 RepID=UPI002B4C813C